ncbi:MAG: amino acid permease [Fusobacteriaceae bacterium]
MSNKKISTLALVMIIFIGVFGFGNIANNYKAIGLKSVTVFMLGAVLFFLPMSLIMAEFGAYAKDRTAGIYAWIDIGLGSKIAYIAIWSYFIANIFYLPTLATRVPTYLSFVLQGDSNIENITMAILATMTMIFAVFIGIKFESGFNKISSVIGYLSLFVAGIFLVGGAYVFLTGNSSTVIESGEFAFKLSEKSGLSSFLSSFAWIIFAYGGSEICGTYVDKIENPERKFVRGILLSSLLIGTLYILGIISISAFGTAEEFSKVSLVNAVISGYGFMGSKLGLGIWFVRFIGASYTLITLVALVLWSVALSKVVFSEVPEGTFPNWLTAKNRSGVLRNALVFQTVLALIFIAITTLGGDAAEEFYYKVYDMSTMAFLVPYIFLSIAYINFRMKGHKSPFQAVKNNYLAYALGGLVTVMVAGAFLFAGIDISKPLGEQMSTIKLYYGGLFLFLILGMILKVINNRYSK